MSGNASKVTLHNQTTYPATKPKADYRWHPPAFLLPALSSSAPVSFSKRLLLPYPWTAFSKSPANAINKK